VSTSKVSVTAQHKTVLKQNSYYTHTTTSSEIITHNLLNWAFLGVQGNWEKKGCNICITYVLPVIYK